MRSPKNLHYFTLGNHRFASYISLLDAWVEELSDLILDAGCGTGSSELKHAASEKCTVIGIDVLRKNVKDFASKGGIGIVGSVTDLPFKPGIFRAVVCIDVLEHVKEKKKSIKEMCRVSRLFIGSTTNLLNPYMLLDVLLPKSVTAKLAPTIGEYYERHSRFSNAQLARAIALTGFSTEFVNLSYPPFNLWVYRYYPQRLPWYAYVWTVTDKIISKLPIMKEVIVFRARMPE